MHVVDTTGSEFSRHFPMAASVAALLHPFAEVVLHDSRADRIVGIWNAFSDRCVGDPSYLGTDFDPTLDEDVYGPYEKANPDGTRMKAVSSTIRDASGAVIGYLCINFDVSRFDDAIGLLGMLSATPVQRPEEHFRYDIREQLNLLIRDYVTARNKRLEALTREERIELIREIDRKGFFDAKNGVATVARLLDIKRTNIYHLIRSSRDAA